MGIVTVPPNWDPMGIVLYYRRDLGLRGWAGGSGHLRSNDQELKKAPGWTWEHKFNNPINFK